jgi:hypothetical protein
MSNNLVTTSGETEVIEYGSGESDVYLLLQVPDYEATGSTPPRYQPSKQSSLKIGDNGNNANWVSSTGISPSSSDSPDNSGDELLGYFGGFVDDTRRRADGANSGDDESAASIATPPNEEIARSLLAGPYSDDGVTASSNKGFNEVVSTTIPEYMGWRDHTDGHRITTTRGDKIEVIGGNWKLVSLGRGTGEASLEMSGGVLVDSDIPPGGISSVTWRKCTTDPAADNYGWKQVEQTAKGNFVERFHGTRREEYFGDELVTIIGSPSQDSDHGMVLGLSKDGEVVDPHEYAGDTKYATTTVKVPTDVDGLGVMGSKAYDELRPTKWDPGSDEPPELQSPHVINGTWAAQMTEYLSVADVTTKTCIYKGNHYELSTYEDSSYYSETTLNTVGGVYRESWFLGNSAGFQERFYGAFTQTFFGSSTTIGIANRFELFLGLEEQINIGVSAEVKLGASVSLGVGPSVEFEISRTEGEIFKKCVSLAEVEAKVAELEVRVTGNSAAVTVVETTISAVQASVTRAALALQTHV